MSRLRYAGLAGTVGSGNMTNSATSHTFTAALTYGAGATVPTLAGSDYFMLSILDTSGNLSEVVKVTAYNSGTKAATIVRAQEGTTGVAHTSGDAVTLAAYPTDLSDTGVIAYNAYNPGSLATYTTTGTTAADVDAANMAVTFTAPASGKVLVRLSALTVCSGLGHTGYWDLRESSTTLATKEVMNAKIASFESPMSVPFVLTGVTAGSHTYKWAYHTTSGNTGWTVFAGGIAGDAVMEIVALP